MIPEHVGKLGVIFQLSCFHGFHISERHYAPITLHQTIAYDDFDERCGEVGGGIEHGIFPSIAKP
jgi:hypothetical protein